MDAKVIFLGGWINWNILSEVYIFTKGKNIKAKKNENFD